MEITRYSIPTKYDYFERGTCIKVCSREGYYIYIQVSPDSEQPLWELLDVVKHTDRVTT